MQRPVQPKRELRVLHLDAGNIFGGIETILLNLARVQGKAGLWHSYLLTSEGRLATALRDCGVQVDMTRPVRLRNPLSVARARRTLSKLLAHAAHDVVIAHGPWALTVFGPAVRLAGCPLVFYQHGAISQHWLEKLAARNTVTLRLANSLYTESTGARLFGHAPSRVLRPPIGPPRPIDRTHLRTSLGLQPGEVAIISASRFERWKGQLLLAEALTRLPARGWRWVLAGATSRPDERALLEAVVHVVRGAKLQDRLVVLGERDDVPELMLAADIFCQANLAPEPFGIAFVEALWAALPIVTSTEAGGALEMLDASIARIVAPRADALAHALEELVQDAGVRKRLGAAGPERARQFCEPERMLSALSGMLREAVGRSDEAMTWA
jgi:glycosyltransferase involved in cell wall biosynthesis